MATITSAGVKIPQRGDEPRFQALRELGESVDVPADLAFTGKIRCLQTDSVQTFPNTTTLSRINNWEPHAGGVSALGATDQGDACGIFLENPLSAILRVTDPGFYFMYANYTFVATGGGGIRRTALRNPDTGEYYQTRSIDSEPTVGFMGAEVTQIVWLDAEQRIIAEAAQNSGAPLDGGNDNTRVMWLVAKLRLM